jgi:acylphosphatase
MKLPPLSLGLSLGVEAAKAVDSESFSIGQAHGYLCKAGAHSPVHALSGRLQAGPGGGIELTVPASLIKGVFDALHEPGAEFVVRNNRTEAAIKVMTKAEADKLGGTDKITERGHSYNYTLGPIVELPANGDYEKLWAISIDSKDLGEIRRSYGLETSPQLGFYIPVGIKKKKVTEENKVSKLAAMYNVTGDKVQGVGLRKLYHSLLEDKQLQGLAVNNEETGDVELSFDGKAKDRAKLFKELSDLIQAKTQRPISIEKAKIQQKLVPVNMTGADVDKIIGLGHLAYRRSPAYNPKDQVLKSTEEGQKELMDRYRLSLENGNLVGKVPQRAYEQLMGTRPMYRAFSPKLLVRSEEEALAGVDDLTKKRLLGMIGQNKGFLR